MHVSRGTGPGEQLAAEAEAGVTEGRFPEPSALSFPESMGVPLMSPKGLPDFFLQGPSFPASVPSFVPTMPHLHASKWPLSIVSTPVPAPSPWTHLP